MVQGTLETGLPYPRKSGLEHRPGSASHINACLLLQGPAALDLASQSIQWSNAVDQDRPSAGSDTYMVYSETYMVRSS